MLKCLHYDENFFFIILKKIFWRQFSIISKAKHKLKDYHYQQQ